ncbi:MAG TPA: mycofactocin-associated electron transfer flavoprotein alpha subunit [Acidimicrobiales bacterium]|nr:mycofactocin-associated electron transfer flavoprotein alpha subunit [Acidimicrobiales bacterium]
MIAVIPVRGGALSAGADEAAAEAGGRVVVVGDGTAAAASGLGAALTSVALAEAGDFAPARWSAALAPVLVDEPLIILPASPDGRDLAPRLAHRLERPLLAGAIEVRADRAVLARQGGLVAEEVPIEGPAVATLVPGVRGVEPLASGYRPPVPVTLALALTPDHDSEVLEVSPPDPATMDLVEAPFIVAGGAGLAGPQGFDALSEVAGRLGASLGATRVVTDAGWVPFERQIGTTGVCVDPAVYVALGISGAVQHTSGLGDPEHIVAVNLDPSCPMMAMAEVAIVADAPAVVEALNRRLAARGGAA